MKDDETSPGQPGGATERPSTTQASNDIVRVRGSLPGGLVGWAQRAHTPAADAARRDDTTPPHRFDALARALATGQPRRRVVAGLAGGVAGVLGLAKLRDSEAFICRPAGYLCGKNAHCCSGLCDPETHRCREAPVGCGPQGPQGPQGCCGPQGIQGCQGPQGAQGPIG